MLNEMLEDTGHVARGMMRPSHGDRCHCHVVVTTTHRREPTVQIPTNGLLIRQIGNNIAQSATIFNKVPFY